MDHLTHNGKSTGAIFGLMRDIVQLQDVHNTSRLVFCFDRGRSLRCKEYAPYKANRQDNVIDEEQRNARREVRRQIHLLRSKYLKQIGYRNVFSRWGYEADDIIASVANTIAAKQQRAIIVGTDKDLYQCLSPRVSIWNPITSKMLTHESFEAVHGISPTQWIDVLAMAGGHDNIEGIRGVGDITARKFLSGKLRADSKAFDLIVKGNAIWKRNRDLVELPYPGTPEFKLRDDKVSDQAWKDVAKQLGLRSLMTNAPIRDRDVRKRLVKKRRS